MMRFYLKSFATIFLTILVFTFFLLCLVSTADSSILRVPSEYENIQSAIDASKDGDEVLVADGTYTGNDNKNLDFAGKAIIVRSENGPEHCVIDCENNGRGFYFHSGEQNTSVVEGFTIQNGYIADAPHITDAPPHWSLNSGAGILCDSSSPTIANNTITGCEALYSGGGICCFHSSTVITNNIITNNLAYMGSGIYCFESSPIIDDNTIMDNLATQSGGGISCGDSSPIINSNTITGNSAIAGGGIECYHYASPVITNNVISNNSAGKMGGGVFCYDTSTPVITNCTIIGNLSSDPRSSGIYCGHFAAPVVVNTILWNKRREVFLETSSITIRYSNVKGGYDGEGNISESPLFFAPRKNYHLRPASPCIGAGTNVGVPSFDKDGNPRPNPPGSNCDIGAYESRLGQPRGAKLAPKMTEKLSSTWGKIKSF
ncbi:DUF1565 domain-containing protein [bacterium]|nr:DUF1565 domain-containing protein [bacterium]